MMGILFLLVSLWLGLIIADEFNLADRNLWVRLAVAITVGTLISTWLTFLLSLLIGFNLTSVNLALLTISAVISFFRVKGRTSWKKHIVSTDKSIAFSHAVLLIFVMPFFVFGVWESKSGDILYLGNYADLSYHLSIVSSFLDQTPFPPENPQCAGAKMSYHFLVNFHSAILCLGGLGLFLSVIIPQILFSFALATMLYSFYRLIQENETSTFFSVTFLIMGHIAFFNFLFALLGYRPSRIPFDITSWHSVRQHLLFPFFNFLDPIINYFHPQRPFLFAFPLCLIVLSCLYKMFKNKEADYKLLFGLSAIVGLTPLFHIHTFLVLAPILVVAALYLRLDFKRTTVSLLPLLLAAGQIWFILSEPKAPGFSGFDVHKLGGGLHELNVFGSALLSRIVFWIRATGFPLLLGMLGFVFYFLKNRTLSLESRDGRKNIILLLFFTIPFLFFLLINFYRFSPNWGDSNKFFLYFNVALTIFAGRLLGIWFMKNHAGKAAAVAVILIAAIAPTAVEAYGIFTRSGSVLFKGCHRNVADWIRLNTPKDAVFLTSDDVVHYVPPLSGRRVVDGAYTWNTGFKKPDTVKDVRRIYRTGDQGLIKKYRVTHILYGPHERRKFTANEHALERYKLVYDQECRNEHYRIYDVRHKSSQRRARRPFPMERSVSDDKRVFLSDLSPLTAKQDHGKLQFDANFNMEPIILNGKTYHKGLGTHANSMIVFHLKNRFSYFESDVGLDDTEDNTPGSVVFKVIVDGELKHKTPVMRWNSRTEHIRVDLKGKNELKLVVDKAGDRDTCDHASWAGAVLYR